MRLSIPLHSKRIDITRYKVYHSLITMETKSPAHHARRIPQKPQVSFKRCALQQNRLGKLKMTNTSLPYNLARFQQDAETTFGYSPQATLITLCALYERGLISYPKSDCEHLSVSAYVDSQKMIRKIVLANGGRVHLNPGIKSPAWDDSKLTAHHAIIPTDMPAIALLDNPLTDIEMNLYRMAFNKFIGMFEEQKDDVRLACGEQTVEAKHLEDYPADGKSINCCKL